MKKIICFVLVAIMFCLCACEDNIENTAEINKDIESLEIQEIAMPEAFSKLALDTGGDKLVSYYNKYVPKMNSIYSSLIDMMDDPSIGEEWVDNYMQKEKNNDDCIFYKFIQECDISKELLYKWLEETNKMKDELNLPHDFEFDDIDIICSGDMNKINEHFANPSAIFYNGQIYTPKWLYDHSIQDYIEKGLPLDVIKEKINKINSELTFPIDTREAIKLKLDAIDQYIEAKSKGYKVSFKSAPNISDIDLSEPFDATSETNQLFGIEKNGKKYGLRWLVGKDISEYENVGITTDELKTLLDAISEYKDTEEYSWIESCYNKMLQDSDIDAKQSDDGFGNYIYTVNGANCNVEWLCRNSVEEWEDFGLTAKDVEKILDDLSEYKDTDEYKTIEDKYKEMNK